MQSGRHAVGALAMVDGSDSRRWALECQSGNLDFV